MPLKTALRNTFLRPIASSSPGGHTAKISHSSSAIAIRAISAQAGWRSTNRLTPAPRPSRSQGPMPSKHGHFARLPCCPPERPGHFGWLFGSRTAWHPSDAARGGLDRQYLFEFSSSGPQDLGDAPIFGRRHANIGGEE